MMIMKAWTTNTTARSTNTPGRIARFAVEWQVRRRLTRDKHVLGRWLKTELVGMGPAFIKLGQFLSTRIDLLGADVATELCKLQDDIEPMDYHLIEAVVRRTEKDIIGNTDIWIDPMPLASASIGQVHRGRIDGADIVIKVQKPGAADQIRADIATMKTLVRVLEPLNLTPVTELKGIITQYDSFLESELDYTLERQNMKRFSRLFEGIPWVKIPGVFDRLSSKEVLVMEYVPSTKITDVQRFTETGVDTKRLAHNLMQTFIQMILFYGRVHCDPHPGNIGVGEDGDTIVLYDFGNVVKLDQEFYAKMNGLLMSLYQRDPDEFLEAVIRLDLVRVPSNNIPPEMNELFSIFFDYLDAPDFGKLRIRLAALDFNNTDITFRVDQNMLSLFRVFSLLDGTCVLLDPEFSYIDVITPFASDVMQNQVFEKLLRDVLELRAFPKMVKTTDKAVHRIHERMKGVTTAQDHMTWAIVALALVNVFEVLIR